MKSKSIRFSLILLLYQLTSFVYAGEVMSSFVEEQDDHYIIKIDMRIDAKVKNVYQHLIDFKNIHLLNDTIISSVVHFSKKTKHEVEVYTKGCVLFFCSEQIQYQKVEELGRGYIMIHLDPTKSDFVSGQILWQVRAEKNKTRVIFSADFEPDFWVPPLIGPLVLTGVFETESQETINQLEKLAQASDRKH